MTDEQPPSKVYVRPLYGPGALEPDTDEALLSEDPSAVRLVVDERVALTTDQLSAAVEAGRRMSECITVAITAYGRAMLRLAEWMAEHPELFRHRDEWTPLAEATICDDCVADLAAGMKPENLLHTECWEAAIVRSEP